MKAGTPKIKNQDVPVYEDGQGHIYHDQAGKQPVQPGELVTAGYSSKTKEFGYYDYATGKHSSED